ncbi:hypothetical protein BDW_03790 [Bdellovibrio bacteriovorus W]|nr:hypothetical protein BDW_03790 [Bdellovibrio bacteriovorus W]
MQNSDKYSPFEVLAGGEITKPGGQRSLSVATDQGKLRPWKSI